MRQSAFQVAITHDTPDVAFLPEPGRGLHVHPLRAFSLPEASFCTGPCAHPGSVSALSSPTPSPRVQGSRTWSLPATSQWSPMAPDAIPLNNYWCVPKVSGMSSLPWKLLAAAGGF